MGNVDGAGFNITDLGLIQADSVEIINAGAGTNPTLSSDKDDQYLKITGDLEWTLSAYQNVGQKLFFDSDEDSDTYLWVETGAGNADTIKLISNGNATVYWGKTSAHYLTQLDVSREVPTSAQPGVISIFQEVTPVNVGLNSSLLFGQRLVATATVTYSKIENISTSAGVGTEDGDLVFSSVLAGTLTEVFRTVGADNNLKLSSGSDLVLDATDKIRLDGSASGNTYIYQEASDKLSLFVGAQSAMIVQTIATLVNIVCGKQLAVPTTSDNGFLYIPSMAGTPTGTPSSYTGKTAMIYDTSGEKLWIYNGGWVGVVLA